MSSCHKGRDDLGPYTQFEMNVCGRKAPDFLELEELCKSFSNHVI